MLQDLDLTLRHFGAESGMCIHVRDKSNYRQHLAKIKDTYKLSSMGGFENLAHVPKYEMSDDDYAKRASTTALRQWMQAQKDRRNKEVSATEPVLVLEPEPANATAEELGAISQKFPIGGRCQVSPGARRGEVAYVGEVKGLQGVHIGVRLDEPMGNCDGSSSGKPYFKCEPCFGCFAKAGNVEVGDFPVVDPFADELGNGGFPQSI
eukprot:gnl/MRDRNA2_/MRDRNA2_67220_c0_seq1.p1 gnl/MRDRNA2_/MRDRNA2_67220_c0~~gnl/MRDRNA2_/MRDRNA2_67220_c0_seq1.p1  ORF type:complete len:207 (+),score=39.91 gnl/MRDRNA2_/MRDRNA2_67220_c0_seq1:418-1038(+)